MGSGGPKPLPRLSGPESNFLLGSNRKAVIDAALGLRPYREQPAALRKLVSQELWDGLSRPERLHRAAIHNKMQSYDLWKHVTKVVGVKEKPEAHTHVLSCPAPTRSKAARAGSSSRPVTRGPSTRTSSRPASAPTAPPSR